MNVCCYHMHSSHDSCLRYKVIKKWKRRWNKCMAYFIRVRLVKWMKIDVDARCQRRMRYLRQGGRRRKKKWKLKRFVVDALLLDAMKNNHFSRDIITQKEWVVWSKGESGVVRVRSAQGSGTSSIKLCALLNVTHKLVCTYTPIIYFYPLSPHFLYNFSFHFPCSCFRLP